MANHSNVDIAALDILNKREVVIYFSDGTAAHYTASELFESATKRMDVEVNEDGRPVPAKSH